MVRIWHGWWMTACCLAVVSCNRPRQASSDPQWMELEGTRIEYAHKVELARLKLDNQQAGQAGAATAVPNLQDLKARAAGLRAERDRLQADLTSSEIAATNAHRSRIESIRTAAIGKEYPIFKAANGRSYENAKVASVTDEGVKLVHASGVARLGYGDLDESQRNFFGLDQESESAADDHRQEQEIAYYQHVDRQLAANAVREQAAAARRNEQAAALAKATIVQRNPVPQATVSALSRREPTEKTTYRVRPRRTYYYYNYYTPPRYCYPSYNRIYSVPKYTPSIALPARAN